MFADHVLRQVAGRDKMAFWARCHTITPAKFPPRNTLVPLQMTLQFVVCVCPAKTFSKVIAILLVANARWVVNILQELQTPMQPSLHQLDYVG